MTTCSPYPSGALGGAAIQVHGVFGYVDDYPVERYLRREARVTTLYEATWQVQQLVVGRAVTGVNAMT